MNKKDVKSKRPFKTKKFVKDTKGKDTMTKDGKSGGISVLDTPYAKFIPSEQHPSWYTQDDVELRNIASYPFANALGDKVYRSTSYTENVTINRVPGICAICYMPTLGYSDSRAGALNKAADSFYASIYQGYTAKPSFEAPDLMMYMLAVTDINANITYAKRAMRVVNKFSNFNQYLGKILVNAMGFDWDDLKTHLADYRSDINIIQRQMAKSFRVPANFNYAARAIYLASHIFRDGVGSKSQIYLPKKVASWYFDATTSTTGSALVMKEHNNNRSDVVTLNTFLTNVIGKQILALQGSQDINDMSGAVLKVYSESGIVSYQDILEGETIDFEYDEMMLHQIHNAMVFPNVLYEAGFDMEGPGWGFQNQDGALAAVTSATLKPFVYQSADGAIVTRPVIQLLPDQLWWGKGADYDDVPFLQELLLDIHSENPGPVDVIESTRWMVAHGSRVIDTAQTAARQGCSQLFCGSELLTSLDIYTLNDAGGFAVTQVHSLVVIGSLTFQGGIEAEYPNQLPLISNFDWFPTIYLGYYKGNGSGDYGLPNCCVEYGILSDLDNYTIVNHHTLATLNERIFWTMFNIPMFTKSLTK